MPCEAACSQVRVASEGDAILWERHRLCLLAGTGLTLLNKENIKSDSPSKIFFSAKYFAGCCGKDKISAPKPFASAAGVLVMLSLG